VKILVAEDSGLIRKILEKSLTKWGYEVVPAEDGEQAWAILSGADAPHIALVDWMMPGLDGLEVCKRVRAAGREPYTFIILLTGKDQQQDIVRGLAAGADDYLKKPFDPGELEARIKTGRRMVDLQVELIAAREALRDQATTDPLTGLPNRRTLVETLDRELERSRRVEAACAVVFVDLDHFKRVNDTHGHAAGDAVLREAASAMRATLRPYDVVGRFGGEEFVVVLPGCDAAGAQAAAERLRVSIAATAVAVGETTLRVTCSLGVAVGGAHSEGDREALLAAADAALYEAKKSGRNRVVMAASDPRPKSQSRHARKG
jgi:two-component system, cell cycle response regulator